MKRSEVVREIKSIIATCGPTQPTILTAEQVLNRLESLGLQLVADNEVQIWEPEEGWDAYLVAQDAIDQERDFALPVGLPDTRAHQMVLRFLAGEDFDIIAKDFVVTRERVRQVVSKYRRKYKGG